MDVEVIGKYLATLPEDDDHPYRTGPWRPQTTEWAADDLTVVELKRKKLLLKEEIERVRQTMPDRTLH